MDELEKLKREFEIQKEVAFTSGLLHGDLTIKRLFESISEGAVVINESGRIVLVNEYMLRITGYTSKELIGESVNIFLPDELKKRHESHVVNYFNNPRVRPMGLDQELVAKRKDGTTFPIEIGLSYIEVESQNLAIGFIADITKRKEMLSELKKQNAELNAYAHTVAHDLKLPLAGVIGLSDLLVNNKAIMTEEEYANSLVNISQSAKKMMQVVQDILVFSSLKKDEIRTEKVDMKQILESVFDRLNFQIEQSQAEILVPKTVHPSIAVAPWIEEVWFNLVSNAIKYGGNPPKIEISSQILESGYVKYCVKDNGKGISKDKKEQVLNLGSGVSNTGFGLGLSIVQRILDRLGGRFEIENNPEGGTNFTFYLKSLEN